MSDEKKEEYGILADKSEKITIVTLGLLFCYISFVPTYWLPPVTVNLGAISFPVLKYSHLIFVAFFVVCCGIRVWFKRELGLSWTLLDTFLLLYTVVCFLSLRTAEYPLIGAGKIIYYTITGVLIYYAVLVGFRNQNCGEWFVSLLVWVCFVVSFYGVFQYFASADPLYGDLFKEFNPYHKGITRIGSTIGNPIILGAYLALCMPFCLMSLDQSPKRYKWRYSAVVGMVLTCSFLTFSRGAWLSFIVGLGIYFSKRLVRVSLRAVAPKIVGGILVCFVVIPILSSSLKNVGLAHIEERAINKFHVRVLGALNSTGSESFRLAQYRTTIDILEKYPFLGIGFGNFTLLFDKYKHHSTPSKKVSDATTTENMYLMFASETGVVGLLLMAVFFVIILRDLYREYSNAITCSEEQWYLALLASLSSAFVNMLTWDALNHPGFRMFFWIILGIATINTGRRRFSPRPG